MDLGSLLLILVGLAILAAIGLGLRYLLPILIAHIKGSFGSATGWNTLAGAYATSSAPGGVILKRQSLAAGAVIFRYIVTAGIGEDGLYLAVGGPLPRPPVLIPWNAFQDASPVRLFWQRAMLVSIGAPQVSTLTLPKTLYDKIRPHLPVHLASTGSYAKPI